MDFFERIFDVPPTQARAHLRSSSSSFPSCYCYRTWPVVNDDQQRPQKFHLRPVKWRPILLSAVDGCRGGLGVVAKLQRDVDHAGIRNGEIIIVCRSRL